MVETRNAGCSFTVNYDLSGSYALRVVSSAGVELLNISDTGTVPVTRSYNATPCDPGILIISRRMTVNPVGGNPVINTFDTTSQSTVVATQKPFVPFGPTCVS